MVKHNGEYYPAGTEVPVGGKSVQSAENKEITVDEHTVEEKKVGRKPKNKE